MVLYEYFNPFMPDYIFYLKVLEQTNFTSCIKIALWVTDNIDTYRSESTIFV